MKTIDEKEPREETAEDIDATIKELRARQSELEEAEDEEQVEKIRLPKARVLLRINKNTEFYLDNVTPPEALVLVAEHNKGAGGNPLVKIEKTGEVEIDPVMLRAALCTKYDSKKIYTIFPGSVPQMPRTYRRALLLGIGTVLPNATLMEHDLGKAAV